MVIIFMAVYISLFPSCRQSFEIKERPNIVLIMADDMGYSDLGCYGSARIQTPVLDNLAYQGLRFTQFYNDTKCCPTRASLLTGLYPHQAGVGGMASQHDRPPPVAPGPYQGYLNNQCVTIAEVLKQAGYTTLMSGKWHVGEERPHWPTDRGFEKYFGLISGAANYFDITKTKREGVVREMALNDKSWYPPQDSFYMTDAISEYAVSFLGEQKGRTSPFFLYVAFTAPHCPLHAWEEDINKYRGKFSLGWDSLRKERYQKMKELRLVSENYSLSPRDPDVLPWQEIEEKDEMELKMEVYAAQIDRMDQGIGKIINQLKEIGKDDNTLVMFLSDNGACAAGGLQGLDYRKNNIPCGREDSWMSYGRGWANASNTPFRLYKGDIHEGGICTPFIAWWPSKIKKGTITRQPGYIIDIMQTCCDLAGTDFPDTFKGNKIIPAQGKSLVPIFMGKSREPHQYVYWEHFGNKGIRNGNWKLVAHHMQPWELYDLEADRTEASNQVDSYKEKVTHLDSLYEQWAIDAGVYLYPDRDSVYGALNR